MVPPKTLNPQDLRYGDAITRPSDTVVSRLHGLAPIGH